MAFDTSIKMQVDRQRTANFEEDGRKEYAERDSTPCVGVHVGEADHDVLEGKLLTGQHIASLLKR